MTAEMGNILQTHDKPLIIFAKYFEWLLSYLDGEDNIKKKDILIKSLSTYFLLFANGPLIFFIAGAERSSAVL